MNLNSIKLFLSKNSPTILTGVSILGVMSTIYMASQDTIKAQEILKKMQPRDRKEQIRTTWKCYIPTAVSAATTVACILGSHYCSTRQKEALASAYLLSQTTLQEYQKKVIERIGVNKERAIHEEVVKEISDRQSPVVAYSQGVADVIDTGHGATLFYDVPGDRYFKSDINYLKTQVNDLNREVRTEMYFDWNEIMYRWGLPAMRFGEDRIFTNEHPFNPDFVPEIMENGQTRIIISYDLIPRSAYFAR